MTVSLHPTRAYRLIATANGVTIEYSAGQEAYLRPLFDEAAAWNREFERRQAAVAAELKAPLPLSAGDFRQNRDAILQQIASSIGLNAPTELQARCYDVTLDHYETLSALVARLEEMLAHLAQVHRITIWAKAELARRFAAGEEIEGFTWDQQTQTGAFTFGLNLSTNPTPEEKARLDESERQSLRHAFNYRTDANGVSSISATFTLSAGNPRPAVLNTPSTDNVGAARRTTQALLADDHDQTIPLVLSDENSAQPPEVVAKSVTEACKALAEKWAQYAYYRDGSLAAIVIHETTEAGIVDQYLGSADRRWLCEGVANYVAWKLARDRAGPDFARRVYNLDWHLAHFAEYQPQIDLRKWPAVERESEKDEASQLSEAHYPFATRAIVMMTQTYGDDLLPRLFREIGKTPRAKASMKTVATAYEKITGAKLDPLVASAERAPIAKVPSAPPAVRNDRLPSNSPSLTPSNH